MENEIINKCEEGKNLLKRRKTKNKNREEKNLKEREKEHTSEDKSCILLLYLNPWGPRNV